MTIEGTANCQILVSPLPTPVPKKLVARNMAEERRVILVDSRKPNANAILTLVKEELENRSVVCELIEQKKNPVGGEESARQNAWAQFRGVLALGIFD
jgi:hypothetical protein